MDISKLFEQAEKERNELSKELKPGDKVKVIKTCKHGEKEKCNGGKCYFLNQIGEYIEVAHPLAYETLLVKNFPAVEKIQEKECPGFDRDCLEKQ